MSDYLRRRFPLDDTSTVYMSGKAVYNLVRRDKPGIIAPVDLLPGDAQAFRDAVREAMAEAWDEGANAAWQRSTPEVNGLRYHWRTHGEPRNPYREADQ